MKIVLKWSAIFFFRNSVTADLSDCVICEWKFVVSDLRSKAHTALSFHRCALIWKCQICLHTQKTGWIKFIAFSPPSLGASLSMRRAPYVCVSVCSYKFWTILRWSRGLKRGFATARLLGLQLRFPSGTSMSVSLSVVCCQVEVSASGRPLVQRSPVECLCVCVCVCVIKCNNNPPHLQWVGINRSG